MTHNPTQTRRSALKTISAATLTIVTAGCLTRNTDDDVTDQDNELERNPDTFESTITNDIDEFDISNIEVNDDAFTFTVTNTGGVADELTRYEFRTVLFDVNGDEHATGTPSLPHEPLEPGESRTVNINRPIDPDLVASYDLTVSCLDRGGAYCD